MPVVRGTFSEGHGEKTVVVMMSDPIEIKVNVDGDLAAALSVLGAAAPAQQVLSALASRLPVGGQ